MGERKQYLIQVIAAFVCLIIVAGLSACPPPERYEGTYLAREEESSPHAGAILELDADSQGVFRSREQEVSFRWSVRGQEIRFHTKEGGIILGTISNDTITVALPSERVMVFTKQTVY